MMFLLTCWDTHLMFLFKCNVAYHGIFFCTCQFLPHFCRAIYIPFHSLACQFHSILKNSSESSDSDDLHHGGLWWHERLDDGRDVVCWLGYVSRFLSRWSRWSQVLVMGGEIWMFPKIGVPQIGWFIMENHIEMDDFGGTTIFGNPHILKDDDASGKNDGERNAQIRSFWKIMRYIYILHYLWWFFGGALLEERVFYFWMFLRMWSFGFIWSSTCGRWMEATKGHQKHEMWRFSEMQWT